MKQLLLTFFLLACGATAMANTDKHIGPPNIEKETNVTAAAKKVPAKTVEKQKPAVKSVKEQPGKFCSTSDCSRFGLSIYLVDFVNSSNLKLTNMLLTK